MIFKMSKHDVHLISLSEEKVVEVVVEMVVMECHECDQKDGYGFDGAFGGVRDEEVVVGEGVVVISSSLDMLTNSCLGGIMLSLIFLEGLDEDALVEFMVEWC
ncbi:hypothetical protein Tco_0083946 [Tanacetum coccineum]